LTKTNPQKEKEGEKKQKKIWNGTGQKPRSRHLSASRWSATSKAGFYLRLDPRP
jgi:hypothetical protein